MRQNIGILTGKSDCARIFVAHIQFEPETHPAVYCGTRTDENSNSPSSYFLRLYIQTGRVLGEGGVKLGRHLVGPLLDDLSDGGPSTHRRGYLMET